MIQKKGCTKGCTKKDIPTEITDCCEGHLCNETYFSPFTYRKFYVPATIGLALFSGLVIYCIYWYYMTYHYISDPIDGFFGTDNRAGDLEIAVNEIMDMLQL